VLRYAVLSPGRAGRELLNRAELRTESDSGEEEKDVKAKAPRALAQDPVPDPARAIPSAAASARAGRRRSATILSGGPHPPSAADATTRLSPWSSAPESPADSAGERRERPIMSRLFPSQDLAARVCSIPSVHPDLDPDAICSGGVAATFTTHP